MHHICFLPFRCPLGNLGSSMRFTWPADVKTEAFDFPYIVYSCTMYPIHHLPLSSIDPIIAWELVNRKHLLPSSSLFIILQDPIDILYVAKVIALISKAWSSYGFALFDCGRLLSMSCSLVQSYSRSLLCFVFSILWTVLFFRLIPICFKVASTAPCSFQLDLYLFT